MFRCSNLSMRTVVLSLPTLVATLVLLSLPTLVATLVLLSLPTRLTEKPSHSAAPVHRGQAHPTHCRCRRVSPRPPSSPPLLSPPPFDGTLRSRAPTLRLGLRSLSLSRRTLIANRLTLLLSTCRCFFCKIHSCDLIHPYAFACPGVLVHQDRTGIDELVDVNIVCVTFFWEIASFQRNASVINFTKCVPKTEAQLGYNFEGTWKW